jgi:spermidine synthase
MRTLFSRRGRFGRVIVRERNGHRELWIHDWLRGTLQTRVLLDDPLVSGLAYTDGFHLFPPAPGARVLFLGAGGAVGPRQFHAFYENLQVEVVDRDERVLEAARAWFGLEQSRVGDGRDAVATGEWDMIVVDAFGAGEAPGRLATAEMFALCRAHLGEGGVMVVNLAGTFDRLRRVHAGIVEAFGALCTLVHGVPEHSVWDAARRGNTIVHAFRDGVPNAQRVLSKEARVRLPNLRGIAARRQEISVEVEPLRDADGLRGVKIA